MVEEGAGGDARGGVLPAEELSPTPCRHMPTGALLGRGRPADSMTIHVNARHTAGLDCSLLTALESSTIARSSAFSLLHVAGRTWAATLPGTTMLQCTSYDVEHLGAHLQQSLWRQPSRWTYC